MKLLKLEIDGFRGIRKASLCFDDHTAIIGPNGSGKSTIIDAIALAFGRTRMVRPLTEHDFLGSDPKPEDRFRIIATLGGFPDNNPELYPNWFRPHRAVPKWWNPVQKDALCEPKSGRESLCLQIGFAARFDHEDLSVETIRYFHDDCDLLDPFLEDVVSTVPVRLLNEIGLFVLPTLRTWDKSLSFGSELFRRVMTDLGGIPSTELLNERNRLRNPDSPLEKEACLCNIISRINSHFLQLLPDSPSLQLRLTSTDAASLIESLVPHYGNSSCPSLPAGRHGTGMLSLQTFILLVEIGRDRISRSQSFILAMEEPELHLPPGLQRMIIHKAQLCSTQTICTSHSPKLVSFFPATKVYIIGNKAEVLRISPLLSTPLADDSPNGLRKLFMENRERTIEALMHPCVLIPEGRTDYEWLRLLVDASESAEAFTPSQPKEDIVSNDVTMSFGALVGVIPTHDSSVVKTFEALEKSRSELVILVDGDPAGDRYINDLVKCSPPPERIFQWPCGYEIEDFIIWILRANEMKALERLNSMSDPSSSLDAFKDKMKLKSSAGGFKGDYLMYEEIVSVVREIPKCIHRVKEFLGSFANACLGIGPDKDILIKDTRSTSLCQVMRLKL